MKETYDFLKACGTYFLATDDNGQPHVRPFGTVDIFDGRLMIQTGKKKAVSREIHANPKIEICAFNGKSWIRLTGTAKEYDSAEGRAHMLDAYPQLRAIYDENDGNTEIFSIENATAVFSSFTETPHSETF